MTPNPNAVSNSPADSPAAPTPPRLQLDPDRPAQPCLDGAWWPRSTELADELPALLEALSAQLSPIALIGYHRDAWNPAPDHLDLAGHPVHLQGFVSPGPATLVVVDDSGRRVSVRVVPPETDSATAAEVMAGATDHAVEHGGGPATAADRAEATSLDEVAARLARLPANAGPEQATLISQWVVEAAEQFRDAPVQAFVPILVEHIVRGHLHDSQVDRPAPSAD
jgi:Family of unknown function (DUF5994)